MSDPNVHTVPRGDGWANGLESSTSVLARFDTKVEAVTAGRDSASAAKVEHVIHNADGTHRREALVRQRPVPAERRNSGPQGER